MATSESFDEPESSSSSLRGPAYFAVLPLVTNSAEPPENGMMSGLSADIAESEPDVESAKISAAGRTLSNILISSYNPLPTFALKRSDPAFPSQIDGDCLSSFSTREGSAFFPASLPFIYSAASPVLALHENATCAHSPCLRTFLRKIWSCPGRQTLSSIYPPLPFTK